MNKDVLTFVEEPKITAFTPVIGFAGESFQMLGDDLEDVEKIYFIDSFGNSYQASFDIVFVPDTGYGSSFKISGTIPNIDSSLGEYQVRAENSLGHSNWCCFVPYLSVQTNIQNISGDDTAQMDDKVAINSEISNSPTANEGFEVLRLSYKPVKGGNKLVVQCELSLQSSYWGSAVIALFKDNQPTPSKVWSYALMGLNLGQIAKLTYIADANSVATQTWKVRVGRTAGTFPTIYINRDSSTATPYGGATSSWMGITEIDN